MKTCAYVVSESLAAPCAFVHADTLHADNSGTVSVADPDYFFGLSEIDAQHEEIEAIMVELQEAIDQGYGGGVVRRILDVLHEKLGIHFTLEEAVMEMLFVREAEAHCRAHREILEAIEREIAVLNDAPDGRSISRRVAQLVHDQIHTHDAVFSKSVRVLRNRLLPV